MKTTIIFIFQILSIGISAQVFQDIKPLKQDYNSDTEFIYETASAGDVGYVSGLIRTDQINLETFVRKVDSNGDSITEIRFPINQLFTKSLKVSESGNLTILYGLRNSSRSFMVELDPNLELISQSSADMQSLFVEDFVQMENGQYLLVGDREVYVVTPDLSEVLQTIEFNQDCRLFLERIAKTAQGYVLFAEYNACTNATAPWLDTGNKTLVLLHLDENLGVDKINYYGEQGDFPEINTRRNSQLYNDNLIVLEDQSMLISAIGFRGAADYVPGSQLTLMRIDRNGNEMWTNAVSGRSEGFTDIEILDDDYAILTTERRDQPFQGLEIDCEDCSGFTAWVGLLDLRSGEIVTSDVLDGSARELFSNILKIEDKVLLYGRTSSGNSAGPFENENSTNYLFQCIYDYTSLLPSSSSDLDAESNAKIVFPNPAADIILVANDSRLPIEIFSMDGIMILKSNLSSIDVSHFEAGLYVCRRGSQSQMLVKL